MFDAWYNKITNNSECTFQLGMHDTDSFLFKVSDGNKFRLHCESLMDYSNYPTDHENYSADNKAKLGFFKDELCGTLKCLEFVGLRSKCYAMNLRDQENGQVEKKVCKGIGRSAIKNRLQFEKYKNCLFNSEIVLSLIHI